MKFRSYIKHSRIRAHVTSADYTSKQLAAFYGLTSKYNGTGQKIAFIELGGGFVQKDIDAYRKAIGVAPTTVVFHSIDGATNAPDGANGAEGEVTLDLEVACGFSPGAELHIYMADNTDAGFLKAITTAIADKMTQISISWGAAEDEWDPAVRVQFNAAFQAAAAAGITVTAAAGDNGSGDGEVGQHVDFPASSPYVLGCGGTSLPTLAAGAEVVWNDGTKGGATGGGISSVWPLPAWQKSANVPGGKFRGVPDVAGNADPNTGWIVIVAGAQTVFGGTSAVAPMWASIVACLAQALGTGLGFINDSLAAANASGALRDILSGNNGTFTAKAGWDGCTGWGVPVFSKLLTFFGATAAPPVPVPVPPAPPPVPAPNTRVITVSGANVVIDVDGKKV